MQKTIQQQLQHSVSISQIFPLTLISSTDSFNRLSVKECHNIYTEDSPYKNIISESRFCEEWQQAVTTTGQATEAMWSITKYEVIERVDPRSGDVLPRASILTKVMEMVRNQGWGGV